MLRFLLFIAGVTVIALGATWFLERPGEVTLLWQGSKYETSMMVVLVALLLVVAALLLVWTLLRRVFHIPKAVSNFFEARRHARGMRAVSKGLVAIGLGDVRAARLATDEAQKLVGKDPLTLLLSAHTAQLQGNVVETEKAFRAMLEKTDTRPLGLRGLFVEARKQGRIQEALKLADEASRVTPDAAWAGFALLELYAAMHDWDSALQALTRCTVGKAFDRNTSRRLRAVLLTAKAQKIAQSESEEAQKLAVDAAKYAPEFIPAHVLAGKLLAESGNSRRAVRFLTRAWKAEPHPDIAEVYIHIRPQDTAQERLKKALKLQEMAPSHPESAQAVARAAIAVRDFTLARSTLQPLLPEATRNICLLMAELDELEYSDYGRTRQWLSRAVSAPPDAAWVADTLVSDHWMPTSPVTGKLDAFVWKVPPVSMRSPRSLEAETAATAFLTEIPEPVAARPVMVEEPSKPLAQAEPHAPYGQILPHIPAPDDPGPLANLDDGTPAPRATTH